MSDEFKEFQEAPAPVLTFGTPELQKEEPLAVKEQEKEAEKKAEPQPRLIGYCIDSLQLSVVFHAGCLCKEEEPQQEQNRDAGHTEGLVACCLSDNTHHQQSQEACALAADVKQTEVLSGALLRDDLGEVAPGQRLDASLETADTECQEPELPELIQLHCEARNQEVGNDADLDELRRILFLR